MNEVDIKEFYGIVYDNKTNENLGNAFVIIKIEREIPKDVTIYYDDSIIDGSSSAFTNIKIISNSHELIIKSSFASKHDRTGGLNTSAVYIKPNEITIITKLSYTVPKLKTNYANIFIRINDIEYLGHNLSSFKVTALDNLKELETVLENYKIPLKNSLENFSYQPGIRTLRNSSKNDEVLYFDHVFYFKLLSELKHKEFLKKVEGINQILSMTINVLSKKDFDYRSLFIQRHYSDSFYEYQIYNKEKILKTFANNIDIKHKDFINLFNEIIDWYFKADSKDQYLYRIIFNRLQQIKKESDISLRITFIHLIFNHLVKKYYNGLIKLSDQNIVRKIFKSFDMEANEEVIKNIKDINYLRNKFFKESNLNMRDYSDIFVKYNYFINNAVFPVLAKYLNISKMNRKTLYYLLKHVYSIN